MKEFPEHIMIIPILGQVIESDFMKQFTIDLGFEREFLVLGVGEDVVE